MIPILIGLTRLPRVVLLGAIAYNFGISTETDTFFLIYSISLFLIATISYTSEVLAPGIKSLILGAIIATVTLIGTFLFTESYLALLSIAFVISSSIVSTAVGIINREQNYKLLSISVLPYFAAAFGVLLIPSEIYILFGVLLCVELLRVLMVRKYISKVLFNSSHSLSWSFSVAMTLAVAIGGASPIIVKLFATQLPPGSITILAYTFGVIFALSNALSYGATIDKINHISSKVSLIPATGLCILVIVTCILILFSEFWIKDLAVPIAVFSIFIPLSVTSSLKRAYFVKAFDRYVILKSSCLITFLTVLGGFFALPFGILGLISLVLATQAIFLTYLTLKLKQQNYFGYNTLKVITSESD